MEKLLVKSQNERLYVSTIMDEPLKYFPENTIREYREKILSKLKAINLEAEELDFIY